VSVQWGDVATWVAAVGTTGALGTALWQIRTERNERLATAEQLRTERHLEQARLVAAYKGEEERPPSPTSPPAPGVREGRTACYLANNSPEPVYSVVVGIVFVQGAGPHTLEDMIELTTQQGHGRPVTTVSILPAGLHRAWVHGTGWTNVMSGRGGVDLAFSDRAGSHWIRRATGELTELPEPPLTYLETWGFYGPHEFQTPHRVMP
jgi:hypothetical protein